MLCKKRLLFITFLSIAIRLYAHEVYELNTFFFFDPINSKPCNETNYWTPFDQSSTCYRFVSVTIKDSSNKESIKTMLDHNIDTSPYSSYAQILKQRTSNWSRYKGTIDIIDETTIFNLMKYTDKPTIKTPSNPPYKIGHYCSNSDYIINGQKINEKGYWTKTVQNKSLIYAIDENCKNIITNSSKILGIRPVLVIKKSLLVRDSGVVDITRLIKKGTKIEYDNENTKYDGIIYQQLQGFTVTNDKLIFISSNNKNREKSVMYSYKLNDLKNLYKKDYDTFGHGNGMTYNSKLDKVLVIGPYEYKSVYMYDGDTLKKEKEYPNSNNLHIQQLDMMILMIYM